MGALAAERDALAAAAADLEQDRACAAHGEAVAAAEARHLRALVEFLEARAQPKGAAAVLWPKAVSNGAYAHHTVTSARSLPFWQLMHCPKLLAGRAVSEMEALKCAHRFMLPEHSALMHLMDKAETYWLT